ncbi:hypothetical protein IWW47_001148, partial [Coemansia sp. RSA 2052]
MWALRVSRPALVLLGGMAVYAGTSAYATHRDSALCKDDGGWWLGNDCLRLGSLWASANLALTAMLFLGLVLATLFSVDRNGGVRPPPSLGLQLRCEDNRRRMGVAAIIVCMVGTATSGAAATGVAFEYQRIYWQTQMSLWVCVGLAYALRLPHGHGTVVAVAVLVQMLLSVLVEPYFTYFAGSHIYEPLFGTIHSRAVLAEGVVSAMAALILLSTHRRRIYLPPAATVGDGEDRYQLPEVAEYRTPLSRVRVDQDPQAVTPERSYSILDTLLFGWVTPVLRLGTRKLIDSGDLYCLDACDRPLSTWWRYTSLSYGGSSLLKRLAATFAPQLLAQGGLALGNSALQYGGPFFMQRILSSIRLYNSRPLPPPLLSGLGEQKTALLVAASVSRMIYLDAIGLLLCSLLHSVMVNQVLWIGRRVSVRLQGLLVAELSSKALRRRCKTSAPPPSSSPKETGSKEEDGEEEDGKDKTASSDGRIANMLTSDLESIGHISSYLNEIYTLPIKFVLGSWYLYNLLGVSALIGMTITVVYYPLTKLMVKYLIKYQKKLMAIEDERVTMITEMFQGIRAVKLFGWQSRFIDRVSAKRREELALYWKLMLLQLPVSFVQSITTSLMLICILALYSLVFGHPLTADIVFPTITVFSMVSGSFNSAPGMFRWLSNCYVSLKRIEAFMVLSPVQDLDDRVAQDGASELSLAVGFVDACL